MKLKQVILGLAAFFASASAMATNFNVGYNVLNPSTTSFNQVQTAGAFTDTYTFNYPGSGDLSASAISIGINAFNIDFTSVTLNGILLSISNSGSLSTAFTVTDLINQPGPATLIINGISGNLGSYGGNFNVAAVPEPETYALMMAGLGLVGFAARRKQKTA